MTSFNHYINGTDPVSPAQSYNFMKGLQADGTPLTNPITNTITTFDVSGDPVAGKGWLDTNAADRRMMLSSGPFTLAKGETQEVVVGIIVAEANSRLSSVTELKYYDQKAQEAFNLNFNLPSPPPQPVVYVRELDRAIDLVWDSSAENSVVHSEPNREFRFEGYNVWQGMAGDTDPSHWVKIATFDLTDSLTLIYNDQFNTNQGVIQKELVEQGTNSGLQHHFEVTQDYIHGGPLADYKPYYFAVTAYSVDVNHLVLYPEGPGYVTDYLENSILPITATPKGSAQVERQMAAHVSGISDGSVEVRYIEQSKILSHDYKVTFKANSDTLTKGTNPYVWNLYDATVNDTLLYNQLSQDPAADDPIVNGFMPNVMGPTLGIKSVAWEGCPWPENTCTPAKPRWLSPRTDLAELSAFQGNVGAGFESFFGSTLGPADFSKTVEIRFSRTDTSSARAYRRDLGYTAEADLAVFPGRAYDVTDPAHSRRLNICFVEDARFQTPDGTWDPDTSATGAQERLWIMNSSYDGGKMYGDGGDAGSGGPVPGIYGAAGDILVYLHPKVRAGHTLLENDATWTINFQKINASSDLFTFHTWPVGTHEGSENPNTVANVKAVPNPYYAYSQYELNQFDRQLRIIDLPTVDCTIRLFTLDGTLIRTLQKTDPTISWVGWDLKNEAGIPVASGIYLYHVDAKGVGGKVGKVAVFMEKERLNRF